jgi:hypothetical protein
LFAFAALRALDGEVDTIGLYASAGPLQALARGIDVSVVEDLRRLAADFARDLNRLTHRADLPPVKDEYQRPSE